MSDFLVKLKFAISSAFLLCFVILITFQKVGGSVKNPQIILSQKHLSPDGSKLFFSFEEIGGIRGILDINTEEFTPLEPLNNYWVCSLLEWTPDSKKIVFYGNTTQRAAPVKLYEYSIFDKSLRRLGDKQYDTKLENVGSFSVAPKGPFVALGRFFLKNTNPELEKPPELMILNINSGKETTLIEHYEDSAVVPPCWSHGGEWLIHFNYPSNYPQKRAASFYRVNIETGQKTELFDERTLGKNPNWNEFRKILDKRAFVYNLQISPDDSQIAIYARDMELDTKSVRGRRTTVIWKFDLRNKNLEKIPRLFAMSSFTLSPSFSKVVSSERENDNFSISIYDVKENRLTHLTTGEKNGCTPIWTWDEKQIIFVRYNTIWIMNYDGTNQRQIFPKADVANK